MPFFSIITIMCSGVLFLFVFPSLVYGADPTVYLDQTYPHTTTYGGYKTLIVEKDKDAYLACVVDKKPKGMPVQWLVHNYATNTSIPISTDTDTHNAFKYQLDKPATNSFRLKIQNVQPSDEALYICRVQLHSRYQADNISRFVKVIQRPQIIDIRTSSDMTKEEGDNVELKCDAHGLPKPLIKWELAGGGTLPSGGRELVADKLIIESVSREHKGVYKCIAENLSGKDVRRILLNVLFPPRLTAKIVDVYQAIGYSRELKCEATGNPIPSDKQLRWYRSGVALSDPDKYTYENYIGSNYVLMKLIIRNVNTVDYGRYTCYAENIQGSGEDSVYLRKSPYYVSDRPVVSRASFLYSGATFIIVLVTYAYCFGSKSSV
ncbi:Basement membrane-specific heparan sulfate proteoglycan core protein [Mactra antiquata]